MIFNMFDLIKMATNIGIVKCNRKNKKSVTTKYINLSSLVVNQKKVRTCFHIQNHWQLLEGNLTENKLNWIIVY